MVNARLPSISNGSPASSAKNSHGLQHLRHEGRYAKKLIVRRPDPSGPGGSTATGVRARLFVFKPGSRVSISNPGTSNR